MRRVMAEAMEDGAFGVSYALIYPPDSYADTDEIVEVCKVVAQYGGVYITHMRSEADTFLEALDEAIEIGERSGAAVEVYHLKAIGQAQLAQDAGRDRADQRGAGRRAWTSRPTCTRMSARGTGLDLGLAALGVRRAASSTRICAIRRCARRYRDAALNPTERLGADGRPLHGPEGVMPVGFEKPENQQYAGKRLTEIAAMRGQHWVDAALDLLLDEGQRIGTIYFTMTEENMAPQLQQPWNKISTDAGGLDPAWAKPQGPTHPRAYGTYTRVLGKYVREEKALTLEDAVRKMTSAPSPIGSACASAACCAPAATPTSSSSIRRRSATAPPSRSRTSSRSASATSG